jgi:hypothetical protein
VLIAFLFGLTLILSCAPPVQRPTGPAGNYEDAKDMFKRGRFDRALEFTDSLATATPPNEFTERARVLRAVIYAGELESYKEMAETYGKGADETKNPSFKASYGSLRHDNLQSGGTAALGLAETAHQLVGGGMPRELTLEVPFPTTEGPIEVKEFQRVKSGGWLEPDQQDAAAVDCLNKWIDDALAGAVAGDRSKARSALATGSTKIEGLDFALFLGSQLVEGAALFDRKHSRDAQRLKTLCSEADEVAQAALALLRENPDKDKEKEVKKLQDRIKTTLKNV